MNESRNGAGGPGSGLSPRSATGLSGPSRVSEFEAARARGLRALLDRLETAGVWYGEALRNWRDAGRPLTGPVYGARLQADANVKAARLGILLWAEEYGLPVIVPTIDAPRETTLDSVKLSELLADVEEHLSEAADEHRAHADEDPPANAASRLLAAIEGFPEAPIPACNVTRGLLSRVRQARASVGIVAASSGGAA